MIDVPVDEWAKVVMSTSTACRPSDAEKQAEFGQKQGAATHIFGSRG